MKAKFIAVKDKFEMRLENGTILASKANEKKAPFLKRVKEEAALDVGDLEISELKAESFSGFSVEKLKVAKTKEKGLLVDLIEEAIIARSKNEGASDAAAKKLAEVVAAATLAKANVGCAIEFQAHRTASKTKGIINGVWIDKRVPMALYRIFDEDDKMYNKTIEAPDLEIGEKMPDLKLEAKQKAAADKEAAKVEKAEAAEIAKAGREALKIAKTVALEKSKVEKAEAAEIAKAGREAATKANAEKAKKDAEAKAKAKAEREAAVKAKAEVATKASAEKAKNKSAKK